MAKQPNDSLFKKMRLAYMTFAIIGIVCAIIILAVPSISTTIEKAVPDLAKSLSGMSIKTFFAFSFGFGALVDLLYYYLIVRCADGKSKGTVLLVLLVLRVLTAIVGLITTKTPMNIGAIIDAVTLFALIKFKKENE